MMIPFFLLMLSCVVRYGDPVDTVVNQEIPAPMNFSEVEARLDQMLVGLEDIDRVDRLLAARDLASHMKSQDPEAQRLVLDYLIVLVEVEERGNPMDVWVESETEMSGLIEMPTIEVEEIVVEELAETPEAEGGEASVEEEPESEPAEEQAPEAEPEDEDGVAVRIAPEPQPDTAVMIASSRSLLEAGDALAAMQALEGCLGRLCWAEVAGQWAHARDIYVYQQREEAAQLFLRARAEPNLELRVARMRYVEEMLYKLLAQYPNTRYAAAIQRNVSLVQGEISALTER